MEKYIWTPDYSVGVTLIDEQHQHFFEIANNILGFADGKAVEKEMLFTYLGELGDYSFYHLGTEEKFFDEFKYEGAQVHRAAHDVFRGITKKYLNDLRDPASDTAKIARAMAIYAGDWLKEHILVMDKQYTAVFHEHGLR